MVNDDLTEEQIKKMEAKLLGYDKPKRTAVQIRGAGRREKIDPSEFKQKSEPAPPRKTSPKRQRTFDAYLYSPEYGEPYWLINELISGSSKPYRRCETEAQVRYEINALERSGCIVKASGLSGKP